MDRAMALLAGAGLGAGLMYLLDPQMGRRRRALVRDKAVHMLHEAEDAARTVATDLRHRTEGLASGDLSVLAGGKRALRDPLRGSWSPSGRALMGVVGGGLFVYGLTQNAPAACLLGTAGLALTAEAIANADLAALPQHAACLAGCVADNLGLSNQGANAGRRPRAAQPAGAGA